MIRSCVSNSALGWAETASLLMISVYIQQLKQLGLAWLKFSNLYTVAKV